MYCRLERVPDILFQMTFVSIYLYIMVCVCKCYLDQIFMCDVVTGNYSLSRVLPQIYAVKKEPIHDHVMTLVSLLPQCDTNEKLGLLMLFSLVAKNRPAVGIFSRVLLANP